MSFPEGDEGLRHSVGHIANQHLQLRWQSRSEAKKAKEKLEAAAAQVQDRLKEDNNLRGELQAEIDENQRLQDQINAGFNTPQHEKPAPQTEAQKAAESAIDPLVQWGQKVENSQP